MSAAACYHRVTLVPPALCCEFEVQLERLELSPAHPDLWPYSQALKAWVKLNCHRRYVPEWLLARWGLDVRVHDRGVRMSDSTEGKGVR